MANAKQVRQRQPLVAPQNWGERERFFLNELNRQLNEIYALLGKTMGDIPAGILTTDNIENDLTATEAGNVLDARQGKALNDKFGDYVAKTDVANDLTQTAEGKVLDARQGKALDDKFASYVPTSAIANNVSTTASGSVLDARQGKALNDKFGDYVPTSAVANNATTTAAGSVLDARMGKTLNDYIAQKAGVKSLGTINDSTKTVTFSATVDCLIMVYGSSDSRVHAFMCRGRNGSSPAIVDLGGGSYITATASGNDIKVKNSSSYDATVYAIIFSGGANNIS